MPTEQQRTALEAFQLGQLTNVMRAAAYTITAGNPAEGWIEFTTDVGQVYRLTLDMVDA